jgi:hypothetical protein
VIDVLGIAADWDFDGHSLYDGTEPTTDPKVDQSLGPAVEIAARHAADFEGDDDWVGLAAVGEQGDLVGTPVDDVAVGEPSSMTWSPDDRDLFASLPTADGRVPYLLVGTMSSVEREQRPTDLAVAVNGTIAGAVSATEQADAGWRFIGLVGPYFRDGANEVEAFEVERTAQGPVLHPVGRG